MIDTITVPLERFDLVHRGMPAILPAVGGRGCGYGQLGLHREGVGMERFARRFVP
jgi:hypothetical protein